jgi:hypothetical protein
MNPPLVGLMMLLFESCGPVHRQAPAATLRALLVSALRRCGPRIMRRPAHEIRQALDGAAPEVQRARQPPIRLAVKQSGAISRR